MTEDRAIKRRFPRISSENAVLLKKLGPEAVEGFAKTQTVGLGGCMFVSDEPIGVGSYLDLLISVQGRVVKTLAQVVYENAKSEFEFEVGVQFTHIADRDRDAIEGLLEGLQGDD